MSVSDRKWRTGLGTAIGVEFTKLRRSPILGVTFLAYGIMVSVAALFMWMLAHPAEAAGLGLLSQKANLAVGGMEANWETYLVFLLEMGGLGGLIFLSFIMTFIYGREYAEDMAKNLLSLPLPRRIFPIAKLAVAGTWFAALALFSLALSFGEGFLLGLRGYSPGLFLGHAARLGMVTLLDLCLGPFIAWIAVRSRGYMAGLGAMIATLLAAQAVGSTEWGRFFPWSVILWYSGAGGPGRTVGAEGYIAVIATFLLCLLATIARQERADCQ
jgi:ABC-2 type transport system permease protein